MNGILVALAVVAIALGWHAWRRWYFEHQVATRWPTGPDGVVPGAESIALGTGGRGALLLHGFGDTPQSMRFLAEYLHAAGWTVRVPRLAGHGASLRALANSRATDWERDARSALSDLEQACDVIAVLGQSMGGAIATRLAREASRVERLVLLVPYLSMPAPVVRVARVHHVASLVLPYFRSRSEGSIRDSTARDAALGAGITSPRLLFELDGLARRAAMDAPRVTVPTLVIHSRQDPRIPVREAEAAFARLGAREKELVWLERSAHVISVDVDRDVVASRVLDWLAAARRTSVASSLPGATGS